MIQGEGQREREKESLAVSTLSTEPDAGLDRITLDHDLNQNQESNTQLTEPPRCPKIPLFLSVKIIFWIPNISV